MDWIYFFEEKWDINGQAVDKRIYFRPVKKDEEGELMAGNMTIFDVYAVEWIMDRKDQLSKKESEKIFKIYFEDLNDKDYFFKTDWNPKGHEDYLQCGGSLFLKVRGFNAADLVGWIRTFLQTNGLPVDSLEKASYNEFVDENSFMRMLRAAATEGEKTLGKEWWNRRDKEE